MRIGRGGLRSGFDCLRSRAAARGTSGVASGREARHCATDEIVGCMLIQQRAESLLCLRVEITGLFGSRKSARNHILRVLARRSRYLPCNIQVPAGMAWHEVGVESKQIMEDLNL